MRIESKNKIYIRDKVFGGEKFLICVPLISKDLYSLSNDARNIYEKKPDVIEWRADFFQELDSRSIKLGLESIRGIIKNTPLIFTVRDYSEGGNKEVENQTKFDILKVAIRSNLVDLIDVELSKGNDFIENVKKLTRGADVKLIISYHNFSKTPDEDIILNKISKAIKSGADIPKIAVMSQSLEDTMTLLNTTLKAKKIFDIPMISVAMGESGIISRIIGCNYGSDMTFAYLGQSSAPGQVKIDILKKILSHNI